MSHQWPTHNILHVPVSRCGVLAGRSCQERALGRGGSEHCPLSGAPIAERVLAPRRLQRTVRPSARRPCGTCRTGTWKGPVVTGFIVCGFFVCFVGGKNFMVTLRKC